MSSCPRPQVEDSCATRGGRLRRRPREGAPALPVRPLRLTPMSMRAAFLSGLVTAGLVLVAVGVFELSLERAAILAPVLVVVFGAAAGLVVLWTKVGWEALQRKRRPWLVAAVAVGVLAMLVGLSLLGVKLPREGG